MREEILPLTSSSTRQRASMHMSWCTERKKRLKINGTGEIFPRVTTELGQSVLCYHQHKDTLLRADFCRVKIAP